MGSVRKSTSAEIDDVAAAWVARGDSGTLSAEDQAALNTWLQADPRHRGAFVRAQAIYIHTERASALGSQFTADMIAEPSRFPVVSRRQVMWGGATAAAVAGIAAVRTFHAPRAEYATARGEIRTIPLTDGSVMMLNTASSAMVRYSRVQREIVLMEGEALFDVAKDPDRPFRVVSGPTEIVALGTHFSVRHLPSEPVAVLVEEGLVDVMQRGGGAVHSAKLSANMRALSFAPASGRGIVTTSLDPSVVESETAWRQGMLAYRGTTLADAVKQFDRYGDSNIAIADPAIGAIPITGLFSAYRPREFIETVTLSLNLRIDADPATNMLVVRRAS